MSFEICLSGCRVPGLNGTYIPIEDDDMMPKICINLEKKSYIQPFMIYCQEKKIQDKIHRYGIFVVPCIAQLLISQPCWVIAEIPLYSNKSDPIYYYYKQIDMSNKFATKDVYNPQILDNVNISSVNTNNDNIDDWDDSKFDWKSIVGLLPNPEKRILISINEYNGKKYNFEKNNDNSVILSASTLRATSYGSTHSGKSGNDLIPIDETREINDEMDENEKMMENKNDDSNDNNNNNNNKWHYFDVDDIKCNDEKLIGSNQMIRVTDDLNELKKEWNTSELGNHDELECFLGCVGKVIDISDEGDDTIKVQWSNLDMSWLPFRACWVTWNKNWDNYHLTMPKYYYSDLEASTSDAGSTFSNNDSNDDITVPSAKVGASSNKTDRLNRKEDLNLVSDYV